MPLIKRTLILMLFTISISLYGEDDLKSLSNYLDNIIANKEQFTSIKENKINSFKSLLGKKNVSLEYRYEINRELYNEYKKYKLDSAIYYVTNNLGIANALNNENMRYESEINLASLYSCSGKFLETESMLKKINTKYLPKNLLSDYYEAYLRFLEHYGAISKYRTKYIDQTTAYRDSLLAVLQPSSFSFKENMVQKYLNQGQQEEAEKILDDLLKTEKPDTPEYAIVTHYLGSINGMRGNRNFEKKYYILSAIADIKNSIKENASFQKLALLYYNDGDVAKAFQYTQSAIEDAIFSGVQFRTVQMSELYSIISASYQTQEARINSKLRTYLLLISLLSLFLILLVLFVYRQMRKTSSIKEELSCTNKKLMDLNGELNEKNELLSDSNHIKEQYIAQFFNLCSTYIDKMEDYRKSLYKLGMNRQYEELIKRLKSTATLENELDELYKNFDSIFLSLYPTFVDEFNSLLIDEERITLKADDLLNKELRIYALLRLGITDSTQISSFLRCSMSTVYNYRTKVRNKASISRDNFENRVMKIGVPHHISD